MSRPKTRYRDAHTHLSAGACDLADGDLRDARSLREIVACVERAVRARHAGAWVRGWGWSSEAFGELGANDAALEAAAAGRPVVLGRNDGHAAWLSAAAAASTSLGRGGVVEDEAFDAARRLIPAPTPGERDDAIEARLVELHAARVGAIEDFVEPWGPDAWARQRLRRIGVSVGVWLPDATPEVDAGAVLRAMPPHDPFLATRGVKIFLDGTLGARTAALSAPYADLAGRYGELRLSGGELGDRVALWAGRGWPVAIHAIGDRAVTAALDALSAAKPPSWGSHRIEHAQLVRGRDLPRFAAAGIVASLQPGHWPDDREWLASRIGSRDDVVVHPLGSLLRAGATVLFGSDWPVSSWDPRVVLAAATDPDRGAEALSAEVADDLLRAPSGPPPA